MSKMIVEFKRRTETLINSDRSVFKRLVTVLREDTISKPIAKYFLQAYGKCTTNTIRAKVNCHDKDGTM